MKKLVLLLTILLLTLTGCEQFTTSYDRIEDTEFRLLDFMYERAEGSNGTGSADIAPGDTMLLTAVFSGKPEDIDNYIKEWRISFNVARDLLGSVTVVDSVKLMDVDGVKYYPYTFSSNTQAVRFEIPIPADIMKTSRAIPDGHEWLGMFIADTANLNALISKYPLLAFMTKAQIIDALASFTPGGIVDNSFLPILLQYYTVPVRVWANIQKPGRLPHVIHSSHNIRYNSRINKITAGRVPENKNPVIEHIVAYKIKGNVTGSIEDKSGLDYETISPKNGKLVIRVESGFSYYVDAVAHDDSKDTTTTMFGNRMVERHETSWQYRLNDAQLKGVKYEDYPHIYNTTGRLTVPKNKQIKNFIFWATVTDEVMNERLRPVGGTLVEVEGCFVYAGETECED